MELNYSELQGIPIGQVDTHSLRGGGANTLALTRYEDREIQKMGRWRGEMFKEYICNQLSHFFEDMSMSMKKAFGFVNMEGGVWSNITTTAINLLYAVIASTAA